MSTKRISSTKSSENRRLQPSILRRKRKNVAGRLETPSNSSYSDSSHTKSPSCKVHCGSNHSSVKPTSENASPSSSVVVLSSSSSGGGSSSSCTKSEIPSSSSVDLSSSELSSVESEIRSSSYDESSSLPSPAAPRQFRSLTCLPSPEFSVTRHSPLPQLGWADPKEVWELMVRKDNLYPRTSKLLAHHPQLQPRMRAILLEWLMEVSEVYKLHRETYYLAQDFIDRYLSSQKGLPKQQLQLLGITCLFLASKIEEIYPPKLTEFSYVTDNACTENEIIEKELVVLKVLNWDLTPLTVNGWLNVYLQLASSLHTSGDCDKFVFPDYPGIVLVKVAQLVDLCMLDVQALRFPYGILAAAALYHTTNSRDIALSSSGLEWGDLGACVEWMKAFAQILAEDDAKDLEVRKFENVLPDDRHNIQTHAVDLKLLEKALVRQEVLQKKKRLSAALPVLTPPKSAKKLPRRAILNPLNVQQKQF